MSKSPPRNLVSGVLLTLAILSNSVTSASAASKSIAFVHTHTGESISVEFKRDGVFDRRGVAELNRFLRDHRNGESRDMDPGLFDILHEIRERAGSDAPFHLISAYRSPETNETLRRTTSGVAKKSLHTHGRAIDVRLPGVSTKVLRNIALELAKGGVGYYARSDFIHVDTGRVRRWSD
jgi:uncharacterized protein YcbK (DUF882 family)